MGSSRLPGFYKMKMAERLRRLAEQLELSRDELEGLGESATLPLANADAMIENAVGVLGLPVGIGLNFLVSNQIDLAMSSAARRLLPVRASAGPVLVRRRAAAVDLPSERAHLSAGAVLEWTARMLRSRVGYLVPESETDALDSARDPMRDPLTAMRLLLGRSLVRFDRLTYGYELAERTFARSIER